MSYLTNSIIFLFFLLCVRAEDGNILTIDVSRRIERFNVTSNSTGNGHKAFNLTFKCDHTVDSFCNAAQTSVNNALDRIASEFVFKRMVNVHFHISPECRADQEDVYNCLREGSLATAVPAAHFPVRHNEDNRVYMYPTALLKQLDYSGVDSIQWPKYDILARFSALDNYWCFSGDCSQLFDGQKYDMEIVAMHELMHGLGFGMSQIFVNHRKAQGSDLVLPAAIWQHHMYGYLPTNEHTRILAWSKPSIWDYYTYLDGKPAVHFYDQFLTCFKDYFKAPLTMIKERILRNKDYIDNDVCTHRVAAKVHKLTTTPGTLRFYCTAQPAVVNGPSIVDMETGRLPFRDGSSAAHVALYSDVKEALMTNVDFPGRSFANLIRNINARPSGFGDATVEMMLTLGYCQTIEPCSQNSEKRTVDGPLVLWETSQFNVHALLEMPEAPAGLRSVVDMSFIDAEHVPVQNSTLSQPARPIPRDEL